MFHSTIKQYKIYFNIIFFLIILFSFNIAFSQSQQAKISGKIFNNSNFSSINIEKMAQKPQRLASSSINSQGEFSLNFDVQKTAYYRLVLSNKINQLLVISPGENINISFDLNNFQNSMELSGSAESELIVETQKVLNNFKLSVDSLDIIYNKYINKNNADSLHAALNAKAQQIEIERVNFLHNYIVKNNKSLTGLIFIEHLNMEYYLNTYGILAAGLHEKYPDDVFVISFYNKVTAAQRTAIGAPAPEIKLPNPDGQIIPLSSLLGKIVVIDFWASWCGPCRHENPHKVALYNKYKDKGLTFYSVSLDRNKAAWTAAIESDKLTWTHVSDLKYFQSEAAILYGVTAVPTMFVMDKNGTLASKGLRGAQLEAKINELMSKE